MPGNQRSARNASVLDRNAPQRIPLNWGATCTRCGEWIDKGTLAVWDPIAKTVRHLDCISTKLAGSQADRDHALHEQSVRASSKALREQWDRVARSGRDPGVTVTRMSESEHQ